MTTTANAACVVFRVFLRAILCAVCALCASRLVVHAQFQMPDPKQMSGIPRPVSDLPNGTVSVRLIRGSFSNNLTDFPVEMIVGGKTRTAKTDDGGRAEFRNLPVGEMVKVAAVVDGERLESQTFPAPAEGGIRVMLVATDNSRTSAPAATGSAAPGKVLLSSRSRLVLEPGEAGVAVYYILDIVNNTGGPVTPTPDFAFDMPDGAVSTSLLEGSSPNATVTGNHVSVDGPFAPGQTLVQVASEVPVDSATYALTQRFPAALEQLAVVVKKVGNTTLESPQLKNQQQMTASGETFIAATGDAVAAGVPVALVVGGLPHHNGAPRWIALGLAGGIILAGVWLSGRDRNAQARQEQRLRLIERRDRLLNALVRLEHDRRGGKIAQARYVTRRDELMTALEHVYGVLDSDDMDPGPDRSVAA